ncbi:MAG: hypothetical protein QOH36_1293 [Actinomycetota bacterium]|nr:hypothetical protein [Actinomycetota bacterium]
MTPIQDSLRLDLNAFLLRNAVTPMQSLTDTAQATAMFYSVAPGDAAALFVPDAQTPDTLGPVVAAILARPTGPPNWQLFIREALVLPAFGLSAGQSLGAAVFCAVSDPEDQTMRWVVWTFGSAARSIRRRAIDPRFGLIIALNRISESEAEDPVEYRTRGRVRQLQFRTPSPYAQHTEVRAANDVPVEGYRMDRMVDIVSAVGGRVSDTTIGHVFGSRSFKYRGEVACIDDLVSSSEVLMTDFRGRGYQRDFSFIDRYGLVEDEDRIFRLRQLLSEQVRTNIDSVDVLLPDERTDSGDESTVHFIAFPGEKKANQGQTVLTVDMIAQFAAHSSDDAFLDQKLRFYDSQRNKINEFPILECLVAELIDGDDRIVLFDGDFYRVDADFLASVNTELKGLPLTSLDLPFYEGGVEATWNRDVADALPDKFVCLDGQLVRLAGQTPFEACDLVSTTGALIHAKRKGRSSTLTYVFTQAEQSCQLLSEVPNARQQFDDHISAAAKEPDTLLP